MQIIYLDNAASTRVDPRVLDAMLPFFSECYANASALHVPAQKSKVVIERARELLAEFLGASDTSEIIFTCGATEANNTVLGSFDGPILISAIEHPSVFNTAMATGRARVIPVDETGTIKLDEYRALLHEVKPQLVSVMQVNNEIGSLQDLDLLGSLAHENGALFHTDLTQGVGKCDMNLSERPIDYATLSAHKCHGPKGVGAIWCKMGSPFKNFMLGGTHEAQRRAGTLNVPGIVGLGEAIRCIETDGASDLERIRLIRKGLLDGLLSLPDVRLNGQPAGAPHIMSLSFHRTEGEAVIINLDSKGICCTAGSACSSGMHLKSQVLTAIGLPDEWLRGTVRLSLGRFNTLEEVEPSVAAIGQAVASVRRIAEFAAS